MRDFQFMDVDMRSLRGNQNENGKNMLTFQEGNKVDTTNRCEALKEVMSLNYVSY